jgi:hypothetical protein
LAAIRERSVTEPGKPERIALPLGVLSRETVKGLAKRNVITIQDRSRTLASATRLPVVELRGISDAPNDKTTLVGWSVLAQKTIDSVQCCTFIQGACPW